MELEFLKYQETPNEKFEGVATIRIDRRFIFRFKLISTEKGKFLGTASIKAGQKDDGRDQYLEAFEFDSKYESDTIKNFVLAEIKLAKQNARVNPATPGNVFETDDSLPF